MSATLYTEHNRRHANGVCCMDAACHRRFDCAMEARGAGHTLAPGDDPREVEAARDEPMLHAQACAGWVCRLALFVSVAVLSGAGLLWLLWRHDATLRHWLHAALDALHAIGYAAMNVMW